MLQGSPGYRPKDCRRVVADNIQPNATDTRSKPMEQGHRDSHLVLQRLCGPQHFVKGFRLCFNPHGQRTVRGGLVVSEQALGSNVISHSGMLAALLATSTRTQAATESPDDVDFDAGPSVYKLFHFMWYIY